MKKPASKAVRRRTVFPEKKTGYCFDWTPNDQKCPEHREPE